MQALTRISLSHPVATAAGVLVLTLAFGSGLLVLRTDVGYRAFLGPEHPAVERLDRLLAGFGQGLPVAAVYECGAGRPCARALDPEALAMANAVASELVGSADVLSVTTPANATLLVPTDDGFSVRHLFEEGRPAADLATLREHARDDPLWRGNLLSDDGRVGALVVELASSDSASSVAVVERLQAALAPFEERGFVFHLVGGPVEFVVAGGDLARATQRLVPLVVVMVSVVLWLLYRSALAVLAGLISLGVAVLWTLGAMGWLGWPQNSLTQVLPPLVLVIGACDGIHVLARYAVEIRRDASSGSRAARVAALERVAADVGPACVITSVTTAGGFLSFLTSDLESFARFGVLAALGVMAALVTTFSLLPVLLAQVPAARIRAVETSAAWERALGRIAAGARARATPILSVALAVALLASFGYARLRVDASFEDLYGEQSQVVRWARFVGEHLRRPDTLEVDIELPAGERITAPDALEALESLEAELPRVSGLGRVHSVLVPLRRAHRLMRDDDPAFERVPESARATSQLLLLLTLDDPHQLAPWLNLDQSRTRMSVEAEKAPQQELRATLSAVRAFIADWRPAGWTVSLTGPLAIVHDMIEEIRHTQLASFASAGLVVFACVSLFLWSPGLGLLAMIPTGFPVVLTLGAMGLAGVSLDVGTAMVAAVVLGIAVDDAVHLLAQYRRRRRDGLAPGPAMEAAVTHVGRALVTTSIALVLGFASMVVSPWQSVASFGLVAALAIAAALVSVLVLLPALVSFGTARGDAALPDPLD